MIIQAMPYPPVAGGGGGGPTYISTGAHSVNSLVANYPASITAGDFLLAAISGNASVDSEWSASGWTRITKVQTASSVGASVANSLTLLYKVAAGTESGTQTFVRSGSLANAENATISRFTGVASFESVRARITNDHSGAAMSTAPVTTTGTGELIVNVFGTDTASNLAEEAGWTEAFDYMQNNSGSSDYGIALHYAASSGTGVQATEEPTPSLAASPWAMASLALMGSGTMPTPSIAVRGSRITWINNSNSVVFTLPPSSAAGDLCVVFASNGWNVNLPSGWIKINEDAGSNINGMAFHKILTPSDISTGTVTVTFTNAYYGVVGGVSFVGCTGGVRTYSFLRNGSGASSRSITTGSTPEAGDYAIYFGFARGALNVTIDQGSSLQTTNNSEGSGAIYGGTLGSSGAITATFSYSAVPSGDYQGVIVVAPTQA